MKITSLSFADDLLMSARGDCKSVELLLECFDKFSIATGLRVNVNKCSIYFGVVDERTKEYIMKQTGFKEGKIPFQYLGIPIIDKKLAIKYYLPLIEKIVRKITYWSAKLLSYSSRIQLVQSVIFAMVNFWMNYLPLPKVVIHRIDIICRSFIWSGGSNVTHKSPIAWQRVCSPKKVGGLNLIDLSVLNRAQFIILLWKIHRKTDNLWIK